MSAWVIAIGGPFMVFLGGLLNAAFRRKGERSSAKLADAQAADVIQGAAMSLLQPLRVQVDELQTQVKRQQAETRELKARVRCLERTRDEALLRAQEAEQRAVDAEAENARLRAS